ncbi:mechanosensitive ion channel [archaeon]|jgi:small conductance mechanosensitive channel|nr:mechanosensitive ion channel [archaeon]MBT4416770.1 mechanosensitive ion channel [archaeon]
MIEFNWLPDIVNTIVAALLIVIFGMILGNIVAKLVKRLLKELEVERVLKEQKVKFPVEDFVSSLFKYIIYIIAVIWALTQLNIATTMLYIILGLILVILISFIILAFKDIIPNFVASFVVHFRQIVKKGDYIQVDSVEGKVIEVDMQETKIKTKEGDTVMLPNSLLLKHKITKKKK